LAEGRAEYKRIIDRAAQLGAEHLLFAPSNSALSRREESKDDWSWEHTLWLGLGQKIREGEWDPRTNNVPPSVQEMIDYAASKNVKLVAYVYPVVPFSQNSEWLVSPRDRPGRQYASLGVRSLQDWLIDELVAFQKKTGIGGFAFDHTFLGYEGTSRYAQWAGWRRVMEELRRRLPDLAIDGRQAYHLYGPWSWLAGSYPHPTANDEQPESFVPFPDLHFDRVSADRQRYTAYRYRIYEFAPSEIVPGFATHQTSRADDSGDMPERTTTDRGRALLPIRERDWDYLGSKSSTTSPRRTAAGSAAGSSGRTGTGTCCGTRGRFWARLRSARSTARARSTGTAASSFCSTRTAAASTPGFPWTRRLVSSPSIRWNRIC
jgi:hypothetical protein